MLNQCHACIRVLLPMSHHKALTTCVHITIHNVTTRTVRSAIWTEPCSKYMQNYVMRPIQHSSGCSSTYSGVTICSSHPSQCRKRSVTRTYTTNNGILQSCDGCGMPEAQHTACLEQGHDTDLGRPSTLEQQRAKDAERACASLCTPHCTNTVAGWSWPSC